MYADFTVPIPVEKGLITKKKIKGTTYIYYLTGRGYNAEKRHSVPKATPIGKCCEDDPERMIPNEKYLLYFPDEELPETKHVSSRSGCIRIGAYLILKQIAAEYHLDVMLESVIGKDSGLFLDLVLYSIITENNAGQYYPDYAYNHPLLTSRMKQYSDSKVSDFLHGIKREQIIDFQVWWNERVDKREKIYISYDSTNKSCQAGDIDFVEYGHPKDDKGKPIINYSIAYDHNNEEPLFYEMYPGSIVDISQLQWMLEKATGYGYRHIGFILDRGYFSRENIRYMDKNGYDFVIMMKGMKDLVRDIVLENKGAFEESWKHSIPDYHVNGMTVKRKLFASDEKDRYIHIYFSEEKRTSERRRFEERIRNLAEVLKQKEGTSYEVPQGCLKYVDPIYHKKDGGKIFVCARVRDDVVDEMVKLCGYFCIVTSDRMTAEEAIDLYKGRDTSEKLFRGDKSYLGNRSFRTYSNESTASKVFVEFVALIIRHRFYRYLREQIRKTKKREYMTVPAAIRELEKIEMIRQPNGDYVLDHAVTATQKEILKAFNLDAGDIRKRAKELNVELHKIAVEE